VRYLFRGIIRDTGSPVEGHVEAATEEDGYGTLSENGVVTESLIPDPKPLNLNEELPASPEFADALESAFDSSSSQVDFDALSERYHGKKVWVIDRDKIRRRVAQVVDAALALSAQHGEGAGKARERVASAIQGLFNDTRNLATERNADSIAGMRFNAGAGAASDSVAGLRFTSSPQPPRPPGAPGNGGGAGYPIPPTGHPGLEHQIGRLASLVKQAEATLAAVAAAARRGGGGGDGGGRRRSIVAAGRSEEQNSVLLEIFKSNLALVRGMQAPAEGAAGAVAAPAAEAASAPMSVAESASAMSAEPPAPPVPQGLSGPVTEHFELDPQSTPVSGHDAGADESSPLPMAELLPDHPESR
jgi:hypothetical protein